MYRILVGLDTNVERAQTQARMIASLPAASTDVTAILTHVFQDNPEGASIQQLDSVRRAIDVLEDHDVEYEYYETSGEPASELIEAAAELEADMICLSGRKRTPTGKVLFGSVTQAVILSSERPVTTVSPSSSAENDR
ncbi:universal stress protein [Natronosalvus halobius]|uniref:universal stress protein n=1 Tax=Natronosalvus halobius TaxID=2953746 RepID=UPI00209D8A93|nr:universal stress protein [Natronosalvus halobius]USZ71957.1 universal stress protein [Natronosalvus halobius]